MTEPGIALSRTSTPEQARDVRARAWEFIFNCHAKKKSGPDKPLKNDAKEVSNDSRRTPSIPEK